MRSGWRTVSRINYHARIMANVLGSLVIVLEMQTAAFKRGMDEARKISFDTSADIVRSVEKIGESFTKLKFGDATQFAKSAEIVSGLFAGAAIAAVSATVVMAKEVSEQIKQLSKLSEAYGVSIETLSGYRLASEITGVGMDQLAGGMARLARAASAAQDSHTKQAAAFKALGISVTDATGKLKPMNDLLLNLADKFSKMEAGPQKAALAMQLFGRSGASLLPFLNEGSAGLKELSAQAEKLGLVISEQDKKAMAVFEGGLKMMAASADGLKENLVIGAIPALDQIVVAFLNVQASGTNLAKTLGEDVGETLKEVATYVAQTTSEFAKLKAGLEALAAWSTTSVLADHSKIWSDYHEKIKAADDALAKFNHDLNTPVDPSKLKWLTKPTGMDDAPKIEKAAKAAKDSMAELGRIMREYTAMMDRGDPFQREVDQINKLSEAIRNFEAKHPDKIFLQLNDVMSKLDEKTRVLEADQRTLQDALARGVVLGGATANALREQIASLTGAPLPLVSGQVAVEAELMKTIQDGTTAQRERIRIYEEGLSPVERYSEEVKKLNILYPEGERDSTEYSRALENLKKQLQALYDPTVKLRDELEQLQEMKGLIPDDVLRRMEDQKKAQIAMAETTAHPMGGLAGAGQGISAGIKSVSVEWQGMSKEMADGTINALHGMQGAFTSFFENITRGTMTAGEAFRQLGNAMLSTILNALSEMLAKWLVHYLTVGLLGKASSKSRVGDEGLANYALAQSAAFLGAANAYAAWAWNPPLAATMAETALEIGSTFAQASFASAIAGIAEQGALVPRNMPVFAHAREMILPPDLSQHVQNMATFYGKGDSGRGAAAISPVNNLSFAIHGATDPQAVSDQVMDRVQRYFRSGGVMR